NPSAAVGDGDIDRSSPSTAAPVPSFSADVLVRKAINPSSFLITQLWRKPLSLTRPVCHLARYLWAKGIRLRSLESFQVSIRSDVLGTFAATRFSFSLLIGRLCGGKPPDLRKRAVHAIN